MNKGSRLTNKQEKIMATNSLRKDNYYIVSKREKGQQKIIKCKECKREFDLSESVEYGAAVEMFRARGGLCVGCYHKLTGKLVY